MNSRNGFPTNPMGSPEGTYRGNLLSALTEEGLTNRVQIVQGGGGDVTFVSYSGDNEVKYPYPSVMLVHGMASNPLTMGAIGVKIAPQAPVLSVDYTGNYDSALNQLEEKFGLLLKKIREEESVQGITPRIPTFVAHSLGAQYTIEALDALRNSDSYPPLVRLVLVGPYYSDGISTFGRACQSMISNGFDIPSMIDQTYFNLHAVEDLPPIAKGIRDLACQISEGTPISSGIKFLLGMSTRNSNLGDAIARISQVKNLQVYIVAARHDRAVGDGPKKWIEEFKRHGIGCEDVEVPTDHMGLLFEPQATSIISQIAISGTV